VRDRENTLFSAFSGPLLCSSFSPPRLFRKMQSKPKKKKPPDPALSVTCLHSTICIPLCLSCAVTVGFHLPCSGLRLHCSALGIYPEWASFQWPIRLLRARSLGLFSPEFSVVCGDLVSYGCRRPSNSAIVQRVRSRGSRSGFIESLNHGRLSRSVSIASFYSFPRNAQVVRPS